MKQHEIAILMATYNGEPYLQEQIESILQQTNHDWHLYIRDDGSSDGTINIIDTYCANHPDLITRLEYSSQRGACNNFLSLIKAVDALYYLFSDQDDYWLPEKIDTLYTQIKKVESSSPNIPIVVCSDMFVADKKLNIVHPSWWEHSYIFPKFIRQYSDCATAAGTTGCAMMFNKQAKACCIIPAPPTTVMHDCWVTLCTLKNKGILTAVAKQLVYYRQHGDNTMGAGIDAADINIKYRLLNIKKSYIRNRDQYKMLNSLGYGSVFYYIYNKIKYKIRVRRNYY